GLFPTTAVGVQGEIGRRIEITAKNNLCKLNYDKDFLPSFDPAKNRRGNYIGLGRTFDAVSRLALHLNDPELKKLRVKLRDALLSYQEKSGYLGTFPDEGRRITHLWDVHEMSSVIKSLVTDYQCWNEVRSRDAAVRMVDYIIARYDTIPKGNMNDSVDNFASMEEFEQAVLRIAQATGNDKYWQFIRDKRETPPWISPIVIGRTTGILGHTTAYLERNIAQLSLYRICGDTKLLAAPYRALDFILNGEGMAVTGATSQSEIWTNDQDGRGELGEVCAVANEIDFFDSLLRLEKKGVYGDLMERAIFNSLFASQSPDGRKLRYYTPFEGPRIYFPADTYCCPGIFRRVVSELPQMIYYRSEQGIVINLYTASKLQTKLPSGNNLTLKQETDYPNSGKIIITISLDQPEQFAIEFRVPHFASGMTTMVNGQKTSGSITPVTFGKVERLWKNGDQLELSIPLAWRLVKGRQRQAGRVCLMRGPVVYTLNPEEFPQLKGLDAAEVGRYYINPASIGKLLPDSTIRPHGTAVEVQLGIPGGGLDFSNGFRVMFREFPDPDATCTYFKLRDFSPAVDDSLFNSKTY
ncbi:MAG: glycoside hydrolase family 127 protein, partial [Planctomycetia bacterium]|nr:glycoside hydrolase family 127 protein [Planctomycetia bacterium]